MKNTVNKTATSSVAKSKIEGGNVTGENQRRDTNTPNDPLVGMPMVRKSTRNRFNAFKGGLGLEADAALNFLLDNHKEPEQ